MAEYIINENVAKVMTKYPIIIENNRIFVKLPIEEATKLLTQKNIPQQEFQTIPKRDTDTFVIPTKILDIYNDYERCCEDIKEFLSMVAESWELHEYGYRKSILKKACSKKPKLNSVLFSQVGLEADALLEEVIENNIEYIKALW